MNIFSIQYFIFASINRNFLLNTRITYSIRYLPNVQTLIKQRYFQTFFGLIRKTELYQYDFFDLQFYKKDTKIKQPLRSFDGFK